MVTSVSLQAETRGIYDVAGYQISMTGARQHRRRSRRFSDQVDALTIPVCSTADEFTNADQLVWTVNTSEPIARGP